MNWGTALMGLGQGLSTYKQQAADQQYQREERANQLALQNLEIQRDQMANQQAALGLQDAQDTSSIYAQALNGAAPTQGTTSTPAAQLASTATGGIKNLNASTVQPYTPQHIQQIAAKVNAPSPYDDMFKAAAAKYGVDWRELKMRAIVESNLNPNATGPQTPNGQSVGLMQVEKGNAQRAGFDPTNAAASIDWAAKQLAGYSKAADGDMSLVDKSYYGGTNHKLWGKNTNQYAANLAAVRQAMGLQQSGNQAAAQAQAQLSPADQIAARDTAGAPTSVSQYHGAVNAQQRQIDMLTRMSQIAAQKGNGRLAMTFASQAEKLQDQQLDLQKKTLDVQKNANDETAKLAGSVIDQTSYDGFLSQLQQNPAMQATVRGLNLSGDYATDQHKIATLADRALTLKDQADLQDKKARLAIDQAKEQREQQQFDAPRIAAAQAQQADQQRQSTLKEMGIPFAPSLAATAPAGMKPEQVLAARMKMQASNDKFFTANAPAADASRKIQGITTQMLGLLYQHGNPLETGGLKATPIGTIFSKADPRLADFDKLSSSLVTLMQSQSGASGGGRSSFTAAMYKNIERQKPGIHMPTDTNKLITEELYAGAAMDNQMQNFYREYHEANPDAPMQDAQMMWQAYEQSLGPAFHVDPDNPDGSVPNYAGVPTLPDGTKNPSYRDYHDFFRSIGGANAQ